MLPKTCKYSSKRKNKYQCLGSGSVGSVRFWLPGSGSAKICGSTDPDPRGKIINQKLREKKILLSKPKSELLKKERS